MRYTTLQQVKIFIDGTEYVGSPLTLDQADIIFSRFKGDGKAIGKQQMCACFGIDPETVGSLPLAVYNCLWQAAQDLNELKLVAEGEVPAAS